MYYKSDLKHYYFFLYVFCGAQWSVGQAHLLVGVQRPKPRKVMAQARQYKYEIALGHSWGWFSPRHVRDLTRKKGKTGIETTWEKIWNICANRKGYAGKYNDQGKLPLLPFNILHLTEPYSSAFTTTPNHSEYGLMGQVSVLKNQTPHVDVG